MKVHLLSSDCQEFIVEKKSAEQSVYIENMIYERNESDSITIPLPNVTGKVLQKVIEWCDHHCNDTKADEQSGLDEWDEAFFEMDKELLFEVILAANYLEMKGLLRLGVCVVAKMMVGKDVDEIKSLFNTNDFTPEEEAQIKKENDWYKECMK